MGVTLIIFSFVCQNQGNIFPLSSDNLSEMWLDPSVASTFFIFLYGLEQVHVEGTAFQFEF